MAKRCSAFPLCYKRERSPTARLSWLQGDECEALIAAGTLQQSQVDAEISRLEKRGRKINATCPTPAWIDEYNATGTFPPPSEHTPMRRAKFMLSPHESNHFFPANYLSSRGATYDHQIWQNIQLIRYLDGPSPVRSPTAAALEQCQDGQASIMPSSLKLEPETEAELIAEIQRIGYGAKSKICV